jgi:ATP-binding cassette subfamily F protein 2
MESIDALATAVNAFQGGLILVSHDMRLISQVAKEIWICDNRCITIFKGDIQQFKMTMRAQIMDQEQQELKGDASTLKKEADAKV